MNLSNTTGTSVLPIKNASKALSKLYFTRALFSIIWVALVVIFGKTHPALAAFLFLIYPLWDAVASYFDLRLSLPGQSKAPQYINIVISSLTTLAVFLALQTSAANAIIVFGVWAILTGLIQLIIGLRRRQQLGGQWPMMISGGQSMLGGTSFIFFAHAPSAGVNSLAGYAAFGAFYFLLAAVRLYRASSKTSVQI